MIVKPSPTLVRFRAPGKAGRVHFDISYIVVDTCISLLFLAHIIIQTVGPTYPRKGPRSGPPPGTVAAGGVAIDVARVVDDTGVDDTETLAEKAA